MDRLLRHHILITSYLNEGIIPQTQKKSLHLQ